MSHHDAYSGVDAFGRDRRLEDGPGDGGVRRSRDHDRYDEGPLPPPRHVYNEYGPGGGGGGGDAPRGMKRSYEAGGDRHPPHHYQDYPPGIGGGGSRYHADYRRESGGGGERDSRRYGQYDDRGPPARRDQWQQPPPPPPPYRDAYVGDSRDIRDNRGGDRRYGGSGGPDDHRSPLKPSSSSSSQSQHMGGGNKRVGGGGSSSSYHHNQKKHNQGGKGIHMAPIQSFKSFMQDQQEDLSPEVFQRNYEEYQLKYLTRFSDAFFDATNKEEWFQERYNPVKIQELENDCAAWAAKESALLGQSLHSNILGTLAAMSLDPPRGGVMKPQGGGGGRDRRSGSFTAQTILVEADDAVAGRHLFGHEDRAVYITGISATCSKKLFKAAVTNKLTTTRAAAAAPTANAIAASADDKEDITAAVSTALTAAADGNAAKGEEKKKDDDQNLEADVRDKDEEEEEHEEVFIPAPLRIVLSQPQWSPKNIDSFERSAWVIMPTPSFAHQAVQALNGLRIDVPEQQPSMGAAPFVETPPESIRTSAYSIEAKLHTPKAPIVMSDFHSHHSRVSIDTDRALEMANLLDVQRNVPEESRLKTLLEKPAVVNVLNGGAPSYAAAAAAAAVTTEAGSVLSSSSNGICGPTARLDFAIGYLRRVHFVAFYGGKRYRDEAHLLAMAPAIAIRSLPYVPATQANNMLGRQASGENLSRSRSSSSSAAAAASDEAILADNAGDSAVPTGTGRKRKLDDEDDDEEEEEEDEETKQQQQGDDEEDAGEEATKDESSAAADPGTADNSIDVRTAAGAPSDEVISALAPALGNQYRKLQNQRKVPLFDRRVEVILSDLRARRDLYAARAEAAQAAADQVVADAVVAAAAAEDAEGTDSAAAALKPSTEEAAAIAAEAAAKAVKDTAGCNTVEDEASVLYALQCATHAKSILANCKIDPVGKKSRCCYVTCNKLFKDADFLGKHMRAKHPTFMADEMHADAVPYMRRRFNAEDMVMRPLPPVELEAHGALEKHSVRHMLDKIQAAKAAAAGGLVGTGGGAPGSGGKPPSGPPGLHQQQQQGGYQRQHQHPYAQGDFNNFQGGHSKGPRGSGYNNNSNSNSISNNNNNNRRGGGGDARDRRGGGGGGGGGEHYGPPPGLARNGAASAATASAGEGVGATTEKSFQQPKSENNFARKMSSYLDVDAPKESAVSIDYGVALLPPVKRRRTVGKK